MRDTQKDMASEHSIDNIESIVLNGENDMQYDDDIFEYDSKTLQQKSLFELFGIGNVILKE